MVLAFHKPYGVLSQFTSDGSNHRPLSAFDFPKGVYPVGRLDADSEGLLILTDEKRLVDRLLNPKRRHPRTYWAQIERIPTPEALARLAGGVELKGRRTLPCKVHLLEPQPEIAPRIPPIRVRKTVPDCWVEIALIEGKNRQVRRMLAAIGHPVLRLLRVQIGRFKLGEIPCGTWRALSQEACEQLLRR